MNIHALKGIYHSLLKKKRDYFVEIHRSIESIIFPRNKNRQLKQIWI